MKIFTASF